MLLAGSSSPCYAAGYASSFPHPALAGLHRLIGTDMHQKQPCIDQGSVVAVLGLCGKVWIAGSL